MRKMFVFEKVRFILTGCINTSLDFLVLNTLVSVLDVSILVANTVSVSIGITISYFLNHFFVFRADEKTSLRKYASFFFVTGFSSLIIQNLIIYGFEVGTRSEWGQSIFFVQDLNAHHTIELNIAKVLAVGAGMVWNFTMYKYVIFKKTHPHQEEPSIT